ncbi:MAG: LptF/LptG family permease [Myxococcota bacterium]|nr:LptF/LptG family permease [Myxococcota bacterium]
MNRLIIPLAKHLITVLFVTLLILISGWLVVDAAEMGRHMVQVEGSIAFDLYRYRLPVFLHRLAPVAMVLAAGLTLGQWASRRYLQASAALGAEIHAPALLVTLLLSPAVLFWGWSGTESIPSMHKRQNQILFKEFRIGGIHYWNLHKPTGLLLEPPWLVRFKPEGPTRIRDVEGVRLRRGEVLALVMAPIAERTGRDWIAPEITHSYYQKGKLVQKVRSRGTLPFLDTGTSVSHALGFPEEFPSHALLDVAHRAELAGSDPRAYDYEAWRRPASVLLLILTILAAAMIGSRVPTGSGFNLILARSAMCAAIYEAVAFFGAGLGLIIPRGREAIAAWLPVFILAIFASWAFARLGRAR